MASLFSDTLAHDTSIGAQTTADAERFVAIGAAPARVQVTGNVKYDLEIPAASIAAGQALRAQWGEQRPAWIAGSTHEGEEEAALHAHAMLRKSRADALLVLVPRHPQRFESRARAAAQTWRAIRTAQPRSVTRRCGRGIPGRHARRTADVLRRRGCRVRGRQPGADRRATACSSRPCSACRCFRARTRRTAQDVADLLAGVGALQIVRSGDELAHQLETLLGDPARARAAGASGRQAVAANRGAVNRLVAMVEPCSAPRAHHRQRRRLRQEAVDRLRGRPRRGRPTPTFRRTMLIR